MHIRKALVAAVCMGLFSVPTASARDQIQIVGSSTVYPFSTSVAERMGQNTKFKTPVIESTGTGGGMKLFCQGVGEKYPDITNASRKIKDSEIELCKKNGVKDIVEIIIGNDGIAFANSISGLKLNFTKEQLWKAMAKNGPKPAKWSDIDPLLPNAKIEILAPPPTSGTRDAWNALVMEEGCAANIKKANKDDCVPFREDGAVIEAGENDTLMVQKISANPNAFAIFGFSYFDNNRDKIQAAKINGVEISLESIQSYEYPVSRPLYFYVKKAHVGVIPAIQEYLAEFTAPSAIGEDGYLVDIGLVPLDQKKLAAVKMTATNLTPLK